ncbi:hypothetical protein [Microbacterium barkeri]|uniref:hypothetical protein n=2 Tax=Microbacteriaceae TaxID=85023 RepID=UPI003F162BE1
MSAVAERVRDRLRADQTDPSRAPEAVLRIAQAEVRRHNDFALARGLAIVDDEQAAVREVLAPSLAESALDLRARRWPGASTVRAALTSAARTGMAQPPPPTRRSGARPLPPELCAGVVMSS